VTFRPTAEQEDCIEKFKTGKNLRINAYAGTGKSSTLSLLGGVARGPGLCIMFNKSTAEDARKKMPPIVTCSTTHALSFKRMVRKYGAPKLVGNINGGFLAARLKLQGQEIDGVYIRPRSWGFFVVETVKRWMRSEREEITTRDVLLEGKLATAKPGVQNALKEQIAKQARDLWAMMIDPASDVPLTHDGHLKLYALGKPQLDGDFILLDEAQDTNPVVMGMVRQQKAQVISCGDKHQSIYQWRGAVNAMTELPVDLEGRLSQSWRFGPAIAGYATEILGLLGETLPLRGNPGRESVIGPIEKPRAILARTNGRIITELFSALDAGERPCIAGGVTEILNFVGAAEKLQANAGPLDYPMEFFGFANWSEVQGAAQIDQDAELSKWVNLIDNHGTSRLRSALERLPKDEKDATVVLSTGHKAKGREWDSVKLCDDFLMGVKTKDDDKAEIDDLVSEGVAHAEELRLFYVAATRGQTRLEVPPKLEEKMAALQKRRAPAKPAEAA
jgi:superfamily I DNA/RNA helicase